MVESNPVEGLSQGIFDSNAKSFLLLLDMPPHHENVPLPAPEDPLLIPSLDDLHELQVLLLLLAALIIDALQHHLLVLSQSCLHLVIVLSLLVNHHLLDLRLPDALFVLPPPILVHKVGEDVLHHQELGLFPVVDCLS